MTPDELLKFEFHYTKSLYERGLLERLADGKKQQQEKEEQKSKETETTEMKLKPGKRTNEQYRQWTTKEKEDHREDYREESVHTI